MQTLLEQIYNELKTLRDSKNHVKNQTDFGTLLGEMRWTTAEIAEAMGISENTAKIYVKHLREKVKTAAERCGGL